MINKKILLIFGSIGAVIVAILYFQFQQHKKTELTKLTDTLITGQSLSKEQDKIVHLIPVEKSNNKNPEVVNTGLPHQKMKLNTVANVDYNEEEYIKQTIANALERHRKFKGKEAKETPEEKVERERIWQKNAKIIDNLEGVESTFFALDRAINTSLIKGIREDSTFYNVLDEYEKRALDDPIITQTTQLYSDTFLGTLESTENTNIVMTDFQCGQASCLGSFHSYNNADWYNFIRSRNELFGERFPFRMFVDYPQIIDDNTAIHRIFFAYNGNIDAMYKPSNDIPPER